MKPDSLGGSERDQPGAAGDIQHVFAHRWRRAGEEFLLCARQLRLPQGS